jgi:hypothetical protein
MKRFVLLSLAILLICPSMFAKKKDKNPTPPMVVPTVIKDGLFTISKLKTDWYFEIPDSIIGRYLLAVTRLTAVPQGLGKFSGEEVNENTLYFEKRDDNTLLLRAYVLSQLAGDDTNISKTLTE